ncbi:CHASE2 domain-containing protein, partial [bacterium]|nr:CHASE2 domain-containing protein [bacterium]
MFAFLPLPWNEPLENLLIHARFQVRGERSLSDDIVFVFIGPEDVEALGGWPITRDYYGYVTHVLRSRGAKAIGLYFIFNAEDTRYPEYDQMLSDLARTSGKVILPFAFAHLTERAKNATLTENWKFGQDPIYPIPLFRNAAVALGFSNLGGQIVHDQVPIVVESEEGRAFSFGLQLALHYLGVSTEPEVSSEGIGFEDLRGQRLLPIDARGRLRLNHFGNPERVNSIGFLDLLQIFESAPDSLDLVGKMVIVDVTAPGIPTLEATPFSPAVPASLLHATVAENIINKSYLQDLPIAWRLVIIVILALSFWSVAAIESSRVRWPLGVVLLFSYWLAAFMVFTGANLVLPLSYPTLVSI